jgi:hypothetical protein
MNKMITAEEINTIKLVRELMKKLKLPIPCEEAIKVIGKLEGLAFKSALAGIANQTDYERKHESYIHHVCSLVTGASLSKLSALGHADIPLATLISLGKVCGPEFRDHLKKATQGDGPSVYWIKKKFGKIPLAYETQTTEQVLTDRRGSINEPAKSEMEPEEEDYQNTDKKFVSVHYFGGKAALCFNAAKKGDLHTIMLDAGDRMPDNGGKKVNWKNAIHFQYTELELVSMLAVMLGEQDFAEFKGLGAGNDKSFSLKRQKDVFFMSCLAKSTAPKAVPVPLLSAFSLTALIIRQLELNHPSLKNGGVVDLTRNLIKERVAA